MGACTSAESAEERARRERYDPEVDSSCDEYSDCASSDDDAIPHLTATAPRRAERVAASSARRDALRKAVVAAARSSGDTAAPSDADAQTAPIDVVVQLHSDADFTARTNEASRQFWRMGSLKWRECIDVKHQPHGRFVYDLCLHGGNGFRKEIGYLSSIYDAWRYADAELGFQSNDRTWRALHFLCMQHPGNDFLNGRFRHLKQGNRANVSREEGWGMTKESRAEFTREMPRRLCYLADINDAKTDRLDKERFSHVRHMPGIRRKTMRRYVRQYIADFYRAVGVQPLSAEHIDAAIADGSAKVEFVSTLNAVAGSEASPASSEKSSSRSTPLPSVTEQAAAAAARGALFTLRDAAPHEKPVLADEAVSDTENATELRAVVTVPAVWAEWPPQRDIVVTAAAKLHQRLSRMEPSRDGNTRCMVVLVNKLLCECGLAPAVFKWPDGAALRGHDEWIQEVEAGMAAGAAAAAGDDGFVEAPLPEKWRPENNKPVEHTKDTPLCVRAQKVAEDHNAAVKEAAQFARRPWFSDDLLDRHRGEAAARPAHIPPRSEFESPIGLDYKQRNAFFSE